MRPNLIRKAGAVGLAILFLLVTESVATENEPKLSPYYAAWMRVESMTIFYVFAVVFFVLLIWVVVRNENRSADVSLIRKSVVRFSILAYGLQILMFPTLIKFTLAGPLVPVVILLLTGSFCGSVAMVELVRLVSASGHLWAVRKYWYFVLILSVLLAVVSIVGVGVSRLWPTNVWTKRDHRTLASRLRLVSRRDKV